MLARPRFPIVFAWSGALAFVGSLGWFLYCYLVRFGRSAPDGPVLAPVAFNLLIFSVFAVHHSVLARPAIKRWIHRFVPPELERPLYTWTASLLFIAVCTWWVPVPGALYRLDRPWSIAGFVVQASGIVLVLRAAAALDVLDLAGVRPVLCAASAKPPAHVPLETRGAYGLVRHPIYLGWALLVFGSPVMTATRAVFAVVSTAYLMLAIPWEERGLVELFGHRYEEYRRTVRWRMFPGIY